MDAPKLNVKRTIFVGFAFFLIMAFWQAYDAIMPLMLINKFGMNQTLSGAIMALDNVLAVFLLPVFGALSDKCSTRQGKRTPFIIIGTLAAASFFLALTFIDNYQLMLITQAGVPATDTSGLDSEAASALLAEKAWEVTLSQPVPLICFIMLLLFTLVAMSLFRSPAVALMPDVTVKPLRSKANAVINLMGTAGGIIVLVLGMLFKTSGSSYMDYSGFVAATCAVMLIGLIVFAVTVKEPAWNKEMLLRQAEIDALCPPKENASAESEKADIPAENGKTAEADASSPAEKPKSDKSKLFSLALILASVALWFMGYNAVTSKYSVYATNILHQDFNLTLIIAQAAAVIAYIPVGIIAGKLGRKKTIIIGVAMLFVAFTAGAFIRESTPAFAMYALFALAGVAWATINVNSFPMVVELSTGENIGKYTGYYYTASMAAQIITPVLSGLLLDVSMLFLFPYAAAFVLLSGVTMLFVKFGNAQDLGGKTAKQLIEDNFSAED